MTLSKYFAGLRLGEGVMINTNHIHCGFIIMRSIFSQILKKYIPVRVSYGMYFADSKCDLYSVSITAVTNPISCNIGPRYDGTWLYMFSHAFETYVGATIYSLMFSPLTKTRQHILITFMELSYVVGRWTVGWKLQNHCYEVNVWEWRDFIW